MGFLVGKISFVLTEQRTVIQMTNDLISRQAALDAISCDITVTGRQNAELVAATIGSFADRIKALPSAHPEIIRCKDCKHQVKEWRDDKRLKDKGYWVYGCKVISDICGYWAWFGQDDEFCSEAERRTDEQT